MPTSCKAGRPLENVFHFASGAGAYIHVVTAAAIKPDDNRNTKLPIHLLKTIPGNFHTTPWATIASATFTNPAMLAPSS